MSLYAQGMRAWLLQRLTAVYIALYTLFMIGWFSLSYPVDFNEWNALISHPVMLVASVIFYLSLFVHAWVGVRDILVDYIKHGSVRFVLLTTLALFLTSMTVWLLLIVISLVRT